MPSTPPNLVPVDMERFYALFKDIGLNYQGLFSAMESASRTLGYALASGFWNEVDIGNEYSIHPAILDVAFQSAFAAYSSPSSGRLYSPYLPTAIGRVVIDPNHCPQAISGQIRVDMHAFISSSSYKMLEVDLAMPNFEGSRAGVQIDGLKLRAIVDPKAPADRLLFAETRWDVDISTGLASVNDEESIRDDEGLVEAIERTALYYFQVLLATITREEVKSLKWHHQLLIKATQFHLHAVRGGRHPSTKLEWMDDSRELVLSMTEKYPKQIDLALMHALGENLVSIMRGETQVLEVMMENDMLNRLYMEGCGFRMLNEHIARAICQIIHKYPQVNILEIGAGTGGTTKKILDTIGNACSTYTYTDISAGFFEKASQKFAEHKRRMIFKTLDVEKDTVDQGFSKEQYDVIIAANVLHATRRLTETLQHVRQLLKPGGFLILMESTGDLLRMPFLMGTLPGWWLGAKSGDQGRQYGPGVSPVKWNEILQETGFSGVDSIVYDMPDIAKHTCSMIVSQAVDEKFEKFRDPLNSIPTAQRLLIIGGKTLPVAKLSNDIRRHLSSWKHFITTVDSIDALEGIDLSEPTSVISLTELDRPLFADPMISTRLKLLQGLLSTARNVLWAATGTTSESPESNMFVGICRALSFELPHLTVQFVDIREKNNFNAATLTAAFLRLVMSSAPEHADHEMLWHTEPEIALEGDRVLIPRVIPNQIINERYNASRQQISKQTTTNDSCIELVVSGQSLSLVGSGPSTKRRVSPALITIIVQYSVMLSADDGELCLLCFGSVCGTTETALAVSKVNSSTISVSSDSVLFANAINNNAVTTLQAVASQMIARNMLASIPSNGSVLICEPEEILAKSITHSKHWKGRKAFFATSKTSPPSKAWLFIHPYALERTIKWQLPQDIHCVVDFSSPGTRNIKSCVPHTCIFRSLNPSSIGLESGMTWHDLLADSYTEASSILKSVQPKAGDVLAVQNLQGAAVSNIYYPHVINWSHKGLFSINLKPLETSGLFSPAKTYLMVGMTGELGQSICRWMVGNGARFLVLTSRRGKVNSAWLDDMQRQGATIKVYKMDVSDRLDVVGLQLCERYNALDSWSLQRCDGPF